jgi:hypothetical protein
VVAVRAGWSLVRRRETASRAVRLTTVEAAGGGGGGRHGVVVWGGGWEAALAGTRADTAPGWA